ncbi:MAG: hypothetical protein QOC88_1313 [Mycobacterium sp.]|nr:hypothetical protein [Mycobacterium sp.]
MLTLGDDHGRRSHRRRAPTRACVNERHRASTGSFRAVNGQIKRHRASRRRQATKAVDTTDGSLSHATAHPNEKRGFEVCPRGCRQPPILASKYPLTWIADQRVVAVAEGFEPSDGGYPSHAFEACSLGRSDTPPRVSLPNGGSAFPIAAGPKNSVSRRSGCSVDWADGHDYLVTAQKWDGPGWIVKPRGGRVDGLDSAVRQCAHQGRGLSGDCLRADTAGKSPHRKGFCGKSDQADGRVVGLGQRCQ